MTLEPIQIFFVIAIVVAIVIIAILGFNNNKVNIVGDNNNVDINNSRNFTKKLTIHQHNTQVVQSKEKLTTSSDTDAWVYLLVMFFGVIIFVSIMLTISSLTPILMTLLIAILSIISLFKVYKYKFSKESTIILIAIIISLTFLTFKFQSIDSMFLKTFKSFEKVDTNSFGNLLDVLSNNVSRFSDLLSSSDKSSFYYFLTKQIGGMILIILLILINYKNNDFLKYIDLNISNFKSNYLKFFLLIIITTFLYLLVEGKIVTDFFINFSNIN